MHPLCIHLKTSVWPHSVREGYYYGIKMKDCSVTCHRGDVYFLSDIYINLQTNWHWEVWLSAVSRNEDHFPNSPSHF